MINYLINKYGFGIPLMILIAIVYAIIVVIAYRKNRATLIISTCIFIIVELVLLYMYTACQ